MTSVRLNFADFPDGPAPTQFGNGPSTNISDEKDPGSKFRIEAGKLTNNPTLDDRTGSYYCSPNLGGPVTNIGARWTFTRRGDAPGSMVLLIAHGAIQPPLSAHLVVTPYTWSFGVWPPPPEGAAEGKLEILKWEQFKVPLKQDGTTVYTAEVWVTGETAGIELPDGERRVVKDKRIADWAGDYAVFEAHTFDGLMGPKVGFTEIWARSSQTD